MNIEYIQYINNIHQKWIEWLEKMDMHLKRDVYLYRLKNIYEKTLDITSPLHQEGLGQDGLGDLDIILTYIYEYDGGVIGREGHYKVIENRYCDKNGVEEMYGEEKTDENEKSILLRMEELYKNNENNKIRMGMYTQCFCPNGQEMIRYPPSYYLISNGNENPDYYTKCDFGMYDSGECSLFYQIRYGISNETYYILSGMSEWEPDVVKNEIDISEPCPEKMDEIEQLRHYREYMEGVDLDEVRNAILSVSENNWKKWSSVLNTYGLCNGIAFSIKNGRI